MHNNVKNEKAPTKTENKKKLKSSINFSFIYKYLISLNIINTVI